MAELSAQAAEHKPYIADEAKVAEFTPKAVIVGAPSDQCLDANGARVGTDRCDQSEGQEATAGIRRYARLAPGRWDMKFTMLARGQQRRI